MPDVAIDSDSATINSVNLTEQGSDPATPASSHWRLYTKAGGLYIIDDTGAVTGPLGESGGDMVNPMTDVGDIIVGGTDGAPERLGAALDGAYLSLSSGTPAWITPAFPSVVYNSAWASPPGAPSTGELWIPSDGHALYIREGAAWVPLCSVVRGTTPPAAASWTWVNQSTATLVDDGGHLLLTTPNTAAYAFRLGVKALPTVPYRITVHLEASTAITNIAHAAYGLFWRQNAAGPEQGYLHALITDISYNYQLFSIYSTKFTSAASAKTDYFTQYIPTMDVRSFWLRLEQDVTNRTTYFSSNGRDWEQVHQVGASDYLVPDQVGFGACGGGGVMKLRVTSWQEESL